VNDLSELAAIGLDDEVDHPAILGPPRQPDDGDQGESEVLPPTAAMMKR
jgi:hypothetical protein